MFSLLVFDQMFGVEKGLHILNLFTAMDDTELSHQQKRPKPITKDFKAVKKDLGLTEQPTMEQAADWGRAVTLTTAPYPQENPERCNIFLQNRRSP